MYFSECEHLAIEQPHLVRLITRLDDLLARSGTGVLRPADVAEIIREDPSRVEAVMGRLADDGALRREEMLECPECQTLATVEQHERLADEGEESLCSSCEHDLTPPGPRRVTTFRTRPPASQPVVPAPPVTSEMPVGPADLDEEIDPAFLADVFRQTPLLRYYTKDPAIQSLRPLAGVRVILILHFLRDLLPFVEGLTQFGLDPKLCWAFFKTYPYPQRHAVAEWLKEKGFSIAAVSEVDPVLHQLADTPRDRRGRILVIEDGGFVAPALHRVYPSLLESTIAVVEQTTRGIMNLEDLQRESGQPLKVPVLSVAGSKLKGEFEPPYIGKAVVQNIERLVPNLALNGRKAVVLGCGTIGREVLSWLRKNHADVRAFDTDPTRRLAVQQEGYPLADTSQQAVEGRSIIIGCSGRTSVDSSTIAAMAHGCYVVSASSEQYEIAVDELSRQASRTAELRLLGRLIGTTYVLPPNSREINVLANGYPINFWGMNSMPEQASDLIMSLLLLASAEVAQGSYPAAGVNSAAINELAEKHRVAQRFLEFWRQA